MDFTAHIRHLTDRQLSALVEVCRKVKAELDKSVGTTIVIPFVDTTYFIPSNPSVNEDLRRGFRLLKNYFSVKEVINEQQHPLRSHWVIHFPNPDLFDDFYKKVFTEHISRENKAKQVSKSNQAVEIVHKTKQSTDSITGFIEYDPQSGEIFYDKKSIHTLLPGKTIWYIFDYCFSGDVVKNSITISVLLEKKIKPSDIGSSIRGFRRTLKAKMKKNLVSKDLLTDPLIKRDYPYIRLSLKFIKKYA